MLIFTISEQILFNEHLASNDPTEQFTSLYLVFGFRGEKNANAANNNG